MNTDEFKKDSKLVEKATFSGPMEKSREVMDALHAAGWRFSRTGPEIGPDLKTTGNFLFLGERDALPEPCARCDERDQQEFESDQGMRNAAEIAGLQ